MQLKGQWFCLVEDIPWHWTALNDIVSSRYGLGGIMEVAEGKERAPQWGTAADG